MKEKTKIIISVIITFIVTISITVTASIVMDATDISFTSDKTDKTNVKDSLDELYNMIDEKNAYGVKREIGIESSAWERIGHSKGLEANAQIGTTPVKNDFDNIYPWSDIKSYNYDTGTKSITAWYGESGFTFTPTGNVEVLTYIPEFYYTRYQQNSYEYILISKEEQEGFAKSEAFSIGRYMMSGDETRVHSRSGVRPLTNHTITEYRTYAESLGEGFQQLDYHYFIIQLLYLVEYANYNSQQTLGWGYTTSSNSTQVITSGGCNELGMHSGSMTGKDTSSMTYRGIEDIIIKGYQFVDGISIQGNQVYINYNPNTYQVDTYDGDYKRIGYVNAEKTGCIAKLGYDAENQLVAFPIEVTDNWECSTHVTDNYCFYPGDGAVARVGGVYVGADADTAGLWSISFWRYSSVNGSARLLKTGQV